MGVTDDVSYTGNYLIFSTILLLLSWIQYKFVRTWFKILRSNVKCDFGIPPFGSHWREIFQFEAWQNTLKRFYYKYPDERFVVLHEIGGRPEFLIRDPQLVKQIAVRDFSSFSDKIASTIHASTEPIIGNLLSNSATEPWQRMRTVLTSLLSGQKLKQIVIPTLDENKRKFVKFLNKEIQKGNQRELHVDMLDLSTRSGVDGFCMTAFGLNANSLDSSGDDYGFFNFTQSIKENRKSLSRAMHWIIVSFPHTMKFLFGKSLLRSKDEEFFIKTCKGIADNRIANKISRSDYIQLLQIIRDESSVGDNRLKSKNDYNDIELIAQCYDFYISVVTEDSVLTEFVARQLAANSDIQERLYDEFCKVKDRIGDTSLTYDVLNGMKYCEMVVNEALRMCPLAPELKRRATKPFMLENSNGEKVAVSVGDGIWLPAFIMQNDPQYYPNPERFDPERFSDENRKSHVTGTYAPFGLGPRDCIGCQYPMVELKIAFYYLLLNFKISNDTSNNCLIKLERRM